MKSILTTSELESDSILVSSDKIKKKPTVIISEPQTSTPTRAKTVLEAQEERKNKSFKRSGSKSDDGKVSVGLFQNLPLLIEE